MALFLCTGCTVCCGRMDAEEQRMTMDDVRQFDATEKHYFHHGDAEEKHYLFEFT